MQVLVQYVAKADACPAESVVDNRQVCSGVGSRMEAWFVFAVTTTDAGSSDEWMGTFPAESTARMVAIHVSTDKPGTWGVVFVSDGSGERTLVAVYVDGKLKPTNYAN